MPFKEQQYISIIALSAPTNVPSAPVTSAVLYLTFKIYECYQSSLCIFKFESELYLWTTRVATVGLNKKQTFLE